MRQDQTEGLRMTIVQTRLIAAVASLFSLGYLRHAQHPLRLPRAGILSYESPMQ